MKQNNEKFDWFSFWFSFGIGVVVGIGIVWIINVLVGG